MKDKVQMKLVAIKKGTAKKDVEKLLRALSEAWRETHPEEELLCIPVEVDDIAEITPQEMR